MKGGLKPCDLPPMDMEMEEDWRRRGGDASLIDSFGMEAAHLHSIQAQFL
jgi:hypothetical protein